MPHFSITQLRSFLLKIAIFSIPFASIGSLIPLLDTTKFILLFYLAISFPKIIKNKTFLTIKKPIILIIVLYLIITISSLSNFIPYTNFSLSFFRQLPMLIIMFYLIIDANKEGILTIESVINSYLIGVTILSILFIIDFQTSISESGRKTIFSLNPNSLAILFNIAFLFIIFFIENFKSSGLKIIVYYLFLLVSTYIIISTGSRGGVVGILVSLFVYFYYRGKVTRKKYTNLVKGLFFMSVLILIAFSDELLIERFLFSQDFRSESRFYIWGHALSLANDNLFSGIGVFKFEIEIVKLLGSFRTIHNEFITILVYSGIIGLMIYLFFLYQTYKSSINCNLYYQPLLVSIFVLVIFNLLKGGGTLISLYTWFLLAIIFFPQTKLTNRKLSKLKEKSSFLNKSK